MEDGGNPLLGETLGLHRGERVLNDVDHPVHVLRGNVLQAHSEGGVLHRTEVA